MARAGRPKGTTEITALAACLRVGGECGKFARKRMLDLLAGHPATPKWVAAIFEVSERTASRLLAVRAPGSAMPPRDAKGRIIALTHEERVRRHRERARRLRATRIANHECISCGDPLPDHLSKQCRACLDRRRAYMGRDGSATRCGLCRNAGHNRETCPHAGGERQQTCSKCGAHDHNRRTCDELRRMDEHALKDQRAA